MHLTATGIKHQDAEGIVVRMAKMVMEDWERKLINV